MTLPSALFLVGRVVIESEERYLGARFGRTYLNYQALARRPVEAA